MRKLFEVEPPIGVYKRPREGGKEVNICNEFDNLMRKLFEVEPPIGVYKRPREGGKRCKHL